MLIVKPNDPNVRGRLTCEEVDRKLSEMLHQCTIDDEYASKPAPWPRKRSPIVQNAVEADLPRNAVDALLRKDLRLYTGPTQRVFAPASPRHRMCFPMHPV